MRFNDLHKGYVELGLKFWQQDQGTGLDDLHQQGADCYHRLCPSGYFQYPSDRQSTQRRQKFVGDGGISSGGMRNQACEKKS